jgi:hypothetical protein
MRRPVQLHYPFTLVERIHISMDVSDHHLLADFDGWVKCVGEICVAEN